MKKRQPHVYFAEFKGEFFLSIITKLSGDKTLSEKPLLSVKDGILNVNYSTEEKDKPKKKPWIYEIMVSHKKFQKFNTIEVTIDGKNGIILYKGAQKEKDNDYQKHDKKPKDLQFYFPHIFSKRKGNDVIISVIQQDESSLELTVDSNVVDVVLPKKNIRGYKTWSGKFSEQGSCICAESDDFFGKKKKKKRKKSKVRHSY